jgi:hypothetical protein
MDTSTGSGFGSDFLTALEGAEVEDDVDADPLPKEAANTPNRATAATPPNTRGSKSKLKAADDATSPLSIINLLVKSSRANKDDDDDDADVGLTVAAPPLVGCILQRPAVAGVIVFVKASHVAENNMVAATTKAIVEGFIIFVVAVGLS